jgi:hypothetical protein
VKQLDQLKSVQPWHHKIRNHKIEVLCAKQVQCFGPIARLEDLVTLVAQHFTNQVSV